MSDMGIWAFVNFTRYADDHPTILRIKQCRDRSFILEVRGDIIDVHCEIPASVVAEAVRDCHEQKNLAKEAYQYML